MTNLALQTNEVTLDKTIPIPSGTLSLTGQDVVKVEAFNVDIDSGLLTLTSLDLNYNKTIPILEATDILITGHQPDPEGEVLPAILTFIGYEPGAHNTEFDIDIFTAQPPALTITGNAPTLNVTTLRIGFRTKRKVVKTIPEERMVVVEEPREPTTKRRVPTKKKIPSKDFS